MFRYSYLLKHPESFFDNEKDETYFAQAEVLLDLPLTFCKFKLNKGLLINNLVAQTNSYSGFQKEIIKRMKVYNKYHEILVKAQCQEEANNKLSKAIAEESEKAKQLIQDHCDHDWGGKTWVDSCFYKCTCRKCGKTETFYERD